jgi:U2 small nuclear ribonucleoprotein B''
MSISNSDLKYALYILFSGFGEIAEIIAKKNNRMRGQAFIVFRDVSDAVKAKNNLNGYPIFEKPMVGYIKVM